MKRFITFILLVFSSQLIAAPKSDLWPFWNISNEANTSSISHQKWQEILDQYLDPQGEYTLFKYSDVSASDRAKLSQYLSNLTLIKPRDFNKDEQYAFWVNLYNALTVQLVLDNYPIDSITKLGRWFHFGPWDDDVVTIDKQNLTLNDIEHRILRPIWKDPRTHYAVNCASLGCPNLQPQAFTAKNKETLLDNAANQFINSNKGVQFEDGELVLSSIYEWYAKDFGATKQQLIQHLSQYRSDLENYHGNIRYQYNWQLNGSDVPVSR